MATHWPTGGSSSGFATSLQISTTFTTGTESPLPFTMIRWGPFTRTFFPVRFVLKGQFTRTFDPVRFVLKGLFRRTFAPERFVHKGPFTRTFGPVRFVLKDPYTLTFCSIWPNPATASSQIYFSLANPANVEVYVSDILGKKLFMVTNKEYQRK